MPGTEEEPPLPLGVRARAVLSGDGSGSLERGRREASRVSGKDPMAWIDLTDFPRTSLATQEPRPPSLLAPRSEFSMSLPTSGAGGGSMEEAWAAGSMGLGPPAESQSPAGVVMRNPCKVTQLSPRDPGSHGSGGGGVRPSRLEWTR